MNFGTNIIFIRKGEIKLFNYLDEKYGYIGRIKILDSYEV